MRHKKIDPAPADFVSIRINSLSPLHPLTFSIFVYVNGRFIQYLKPEGFLSGEKIRYFESKSPKSLFVKREDMQLYKDYIHNCITTDSFSGYQKAKILRESSMSLVEDLFESPDVERVVEESKDVVKNFVDLMGQDPKTMGYLLSLSSHDFYTYNHSLDVGILSLGLGSLVGYKGNELQELGEGALLHDIGKRNVSVDIIAKKGALTEDEWEIMRKHPQYGLVIINDMNVSDAIKACCFEHHESCLGNGYPQQLTATEIHPYAKIIAITDTYDALTTKRSYNKPLKPKEAIHFINETISDRYDKEILKAISSVISNAGNGEGDIAEPFSRAREKKVG